MFLLQRDCVANLLHIQLLHVKFASHSLWWPIPRELCSELPVMFTSGRKRDGNNILHGKVCFMRRKRLFMCQYCGLMQHSIIPWGMVNLMKRWQHSFECIDPYICLIALSTACRKFKLDRTYLWTDCSITINGVTHICRNC